MENLPNLPPGFRFYPIEEELVSFYLKHKLDGKNEELNRLIDQVIPILDIYEFNPWDLPQSSGELCHGDPEQWFFFIPRQESEARGGRPRRLTTTGYWKATGSPNAVYSSNNRIIGEKRTMVFYIGRAPLGTKTDWKMNEYKAAMTQPELASSSNISAAAATASTSSATPVLLRQEFSLCRVYKKSKCVRSFDRRPRQEDSMETSTTSNYPNYIQQNEADQGLALHDHHQIAIRTQIGRSERTSSTESSSSGDRRRPIQSGEASEMATDGNNEPSWDWEAKLNWFTSS